MFLVMSIQRTLIDMKTGILIWYQNYHSDENHGWYWCSKNTVLKSSFLEYTIWPVLYQIERHGGNVTVNRIVKQVFGKCIFESHKNFVTLFFRPFLSKNFVFEKPRNFMLFMRFGPRHFTKSRPADKTLRYRISISNNF